MAETTKQRKMVDEFEKVRDELLKKQLGRDYKEREKARMAVKLHPELAPSFNDQGPLPPAATAPVAPPAPPVATAPQPAAAPAMKKGGKVKKMCSGGMSKTKKMAKGGSVRGHGCESKGKTKGRMV